MKIVFYSNHGCMRCHREAIVLMNRGYEVHLVTNKLTQYSERYKSVLVYQDEHQLRDSVRLHPDADIFHCHNEPSWFVTVIKDVFFDKKVILDVHDSLLLRRSEKECVEAREKNDVSVFRISADERSNMQLADGLVFVNEPMRKTCTDTFALKQPHIVLESRVPIGFYRVDFFQWLGGLVYEGRIDLPDELPKEWNFFQYSNYLSLADKCAELGLDFHIYSPRQNERVRKIYGGKCILHPPQSYHKLIRCIGQHDWGLVGNLEPYEEWRNALPNKLFDYWAGCTPVVCLNADCAWDYIKDTGMGIRVDSLEELTERWSEHRTCRQNVVKHRKDFCLENAINGLEGLYKRILE